MKSTTRIATGTIALAFALLFAPATFASDRASDAKQSRKEAAAPCACEANHSHRAQADEETGRPSTTEAPVFTDQG